MIKSISQIKKDLMLNKFGVTPKELWSAEWTVQADSVGGNFTFINEIGICPVGFCYFKHCQTNIREDIFI